MSHQIILLPSYIELLKDYNQLKNSVHFNECMYKHYKHLYQKNRRGLKLMRCAFAWFKMVHYEREMYRCKVNNLINEVNHLNNGIPITLPDSE